MCSRVHWLISVGTGQAGWGPGPRDNVLFNSTGRGLGICIFSIDFSLVIAEKSNNAYVVQK